MRLERLEIGGFGRLRGVNVDFHPAITVLLGPNESGKSTVHRAVRAALFGIDSGGQGRAVERSDWTRWTPWTDGGAYGLALTYRLDDSRRIRVARRLDSREQQAQVVELGGSDITDSCRRGRVIVPGSVHLGFDEAVFTATCWVGDGGLRIDAADSPGGSAARIQEAIERLVDSSDGATAAAAVKRLREAMDRIGTERRSNTPLGTATIRLRQVERELERARARQAAVAAEQQRLALLEEAAAAAENRRHLAECEWLAGSLAAIAQQRRLLADSAAEAQRLGEVIEATRGCAGFPIVDEDRVVRLSAELDAAAAAVGEAELRAASAAEPLRRLRRRREEISGGLRALGSPITLTDDALGQAAGIREELGRLADRIGRREEIEAGESRIAALQREIAGTGFATVPGSAVESLPGLVDSALRAHRRLDTRAAAALLVAGGFAGAVAWGAHRPAIAAAAWGAAFLATLLLIAVDRYGSGEVQAARRQLHRLAPQLDLDPATLSRLQERLEQLRALHAELQRQTVLRQAQMEEASAAVEAAHQLAGRTAELACACSLEVSDIDDPLDFVSAALRAIDAAVELAERVEELKGEDAALADQERTLATFEEELERRRQQVAAIEDSLRRILAAAGVADSAAGVDRGVAAFRAGCEQRRVHERAEIGMGELRRRLTLIGDEEALLRRDRHYAEELLRRGGDPEVARAGGALDSIALDRLEAQAERSRQEASAAAGEAASLRARLGGALEGLASVADLEDERTACAAFRDHALHQLDALRRAVSMIEAATRGIHRDIAPRLAAAVGEQLALLTEQRWQAVNVDAEHFAVSLLGGERPDFVGLDAVSHGTRDQVALLLRVALSGILSESGESVPLLLDEPLITADPERREAAVRFLSGLALRHQLLITTSDPGLAELVSTASEGGCRVIRLAAPAAETQAVGRAAGRAAPA